MLEDQTSRHSLVVAWTAIAAMTAASACAPASVRDGGAPEDGEGLSNVGAEASGANDDGIDDANDDPNDDANDDDDPTSLTELAALSFTRTYYVDCDRGRDDADGTSRERAWKTLERANRAALQPGEQILLKRGCTFKGPLRASWNGTATKPIRLAAYGEGNRPLLVDAAGSASIVSITGSYQIIESLRTRHSLAARADAYDSVIRECGDQPVGFTIGFGFGGTAHHNTVRWCEARHHSIGVNLPKSTHHNKVLSNKLAENWGLWEMKGYGSWQNLGAMGALVHGHANEIANNRFEYNRSRCAWDPETGTKKIPGHESNSIELYNATSTSIHHNVSVGDRVFSEMGSGQGLEAADNVYAFNLHVSAVPMARFVVTRGAGHQFGPVHRTKILNNTVYYTGDASEGVVCERCDVGVLSLRNNVIVAVKKALYVGAGQSLVESHNIFWPAGGLPAPSNFVQNWKLDATSRVVTPGFVAPTSDLRLAAGSPAIDRASNAALDAGFSVDLDGRAIPRGRADIGAYERP